MRIDHHYAREKLTLLLRDLDGYNGDEFWRQMSRIAHGATDHPSAETLLLERDALAADRADLIKELVACQNVLHQLAHAGECTPEYANDARDVLQRVTGGNPPMFDDRRTKEATPCPPR
jgi:hypothetical protein